MSQPKSPYLSVVIPALNEAGYLPRALESLARQSFRDFETIVVDNNSTDDTAPVARSFGVRVTQESQSGVCAARDAGTRAARGQIVVSTDADTKFEPDWLANIAAAFGDPKVVLVAGPPRFMKAPLWGKIYPRVLFGLIHAWHQLSGELFYVSACNLAFRKMAWQGYNPRLTQGGDELFVINQLRQRGKFRYLAGNPVYTSSRRLKKGLLYNFVMTFMGYYLGDYALSKFTKRSLLGSYPAIRDGKSQRATGWKIASFAIVIIAMIYALDAHPAMAHALSRHRPHLRHLTNITRQITRHRHRLN